MTANLAWMEAQIEANGGSGAAAVDSHSLYPYFLSKNAEAKLIGDLLAEQV
jgi:hypothetical protein